MGTGMLVRILFSVTGCLSYRITGLKFGLWVSFRLNKKFILVLSLHFSVPCFSFTIFIGCVFYKLRDCIFGHFFNFVLYGFILDGELGENFFTLFLVLYLAFLLIFYNFIKLSEIFFFFFQLYHKDTPFFLYNIEPLTKMLEATNKLAHCV